jgi:hypothetical protein
VDGQIREWCFLWRDGPVGASGDEDEVGRRDGVTESVDRDDTGPGDSDDQDVALGVDVFGDVIGIAEGFVGPP